MSEKKSLRRRRALASAPVGKLSFDGTVAPKQKQARRQPAMVGSNHPVILLAENRESTRVALKKVLEATGMFRSCKLAARARFASLARGKPTWLNGLLLLSSVNKKIMSIVDDMPTVVKSRC
jgi:hypothetical protein